MLDTPSMQLMPGGFVEVVVYNGWCTCCCFRWGSLFDAVYGFDVIPGRPGPGGYDPSRGLAVLE